MLSIVESDSTTRERHNLLPSYWQVSLLAVSVEITGKESPHKLHFVFHNAYEHLIQSNAGVSRSDLCRYNGPNMQVGSEHRKYYPEYLQIIPRKGESTNQQTVLHITHNDDTLVKQRGSYRTNSILKGMVTSGYGANRCVIG